jgi:hypothetical protein
MWHLTPTALLRSPSRSVFLHPRFWPKTVWDCCGRLFLERHHYVPSYVHMGDCAVCGHVQESKIHYQRREK